MGKLHPLERTAYELRLQIVRMMGANKAHHFGGSMSSADIITALYFHAMRYNPKRPDWPERDRFIMSKGHCVPAQYAALAMLGVFPLDELPTLKQMGTRLQGHPASHLLPGIEGCTGSLGQGLSFANGMAMAGRIQGHAYDVYCLIGDGETHEGQVWEAVRSTPLHCLNNVTAIIDRNRLKAMDQSYCGTDLGALADRWRAFGWQVREIDGHDMGAICDALDWAKSTQDAPCLIIAATTKGKGISFIENQPQYHNGTLTDDQLEQAITELDARIAELSVERAS